MYESFHKQPIEKQQHILESALNEFVAKGYNKANTDIITKEAGISKGLLFYYFGNKKNLFTYLIEYSGKQISDILITGANSIQSEDIFEKIKKYALIRIRTYHECAKPYALLTRALTETPTELKPTIEKVYQENFRHFNQQLHSQVYSGLDDKLLASSVTPDQGAEFLSLVFEQLINKYLKLYVGQYNQLLANPEPLYNDVDTFSTFVKYGIYKE